jgi:hypothetical protein
MELALKIPGIENSIDSNLPSGIPTGGLFSDSAGTAVGGTGVNAISAFIILAVILAILFTLWNIWRGGWDMIMSRGLKEKVKSGRDRITNALLGLIFLFLSFFAISILNTLLGTDMFPFLKFK